MKFSLHSTCIDSPNDLANDFKTRFSSATDKIITAVERISDYSWPRGLLQQRFWIGLWMLRLYLQKAFAVLSTSGSFGRGIALLRYCRFNWKQQLPNLFYKNFNSSSRESNLDFNKVADF